MILFETFWNRYPKKIGKGAAEKSWLKLDDLTREKAIKALDKTNLMWKVQGKSKEFIPNPATWINQKRWEDDIEEEVRPVFNAIEQNKQQIETVERFHINKELAKDSLEFIQKVLAFPKGSLQKYEYEASWASRMAQKYPDHMETYLDQEKRAREALNALQMEKATSTDSDPTSHHVEMVRAAKEILEAKIVSHSPKQEKRLEDLL